MPRVSVIIPTYNRAEFLCSAITSVLNQTFQDFEIIVVDDASNDGTYEVVSSFNGNGIKYIRHKINRGGAAARNTGIRASTGEYIAFLDDDDEWMPEKLQMQVDLLQISPPEVGAVYTGYLIIDRVKGEIVDRKTATKRRDLSNELILSNYLGAAGSSILLRRGCFEKVGLFDKGLSSSQDYDMWIRIPREFHFDCVEKSLIKYHFHKNRISNNLIALINGREMLLKKYSQFFESHRKSYSLYHLGLGVLYCYTGNIKRGRELLVQAIRLYPFEIRHYFNLFLSLLGADNFKRLKETKEEVVVSFFRW
ncbi:MAG: glycosyl transferase [Candidatus Dadabacteria bacterium]